ncbi:MAG TPA: hypothetical protein VEP90_02385, partial [Methylomirabilota bacterium]|nr:hypothetical protein [Methylomirabilota bacterium]
LTQEIGLTWIGNFLDLGPFGIILIPLIDPLDRYSGISRPQTVSTGEKYIKNLLVLYIFSG